MSARVRRLTPVVDEIRALLDAGVEELSDATLLDAVAVVGRLRRLVDAVGVELAGHVETRSSGDLASSLARREGERSAAALIALRAGISPAEAASWTSVARSTSVRTTLTGEPLPPRRAALTEALDEGALSIDAAARVSATLDAVVSGASLEAASELEETLVALAPHVTVRDLGRVCRAAIDAAAPEDAELREEWLRRRSGLRIAQHSDGLTRWTVTLHPEAAGVLQAALDARSAPRRALSFTVEPPAGSTGVPEAEADHRTLPQRRLDALVDLARAALSADDGEVAGSPVAMVVTVPLDALTTGVGTASIAGIEEPLSAATARRLAADALIVPAVLGGRSEVLDLGRAVRLATPGQRRALALRDRGCLWPGCGAPPGWCETAHLKPWYAGGATDLDNLALFCPFHHRVFDQHGWALERRHGVPWLIPPAHVDASRTPRRAGRPVLPAADESWSAAAS